MAKGVGDSALEHTADGLWAEGFVLVALDGTVLRGSRSDGLAVYEYRVVNEKLDSDGGEAGRFRGASVTERSFLCEEKGSSVDVESGDVVIFINRPKKFRTESDLVEGDGGFGVVNSEHRRDLGWHKD